MSNHSVPNTSTDRRPLVPRKRSRTARTNIDQDLECHLLKGPKVNPERFDSHPSVIVMEPDKVDYLEEGNAIADLPSRMLSMARFYLPPKYLASHMMAPSSSSTHTLPISEVYVTAQEIGPPPSGRELIPGADSTLSSPQELPASGGAHQSTPTPENQEHTIVNPTTPAGQLPSLEERADNQSTTSNSSASNVDFKIPDEHPLLQENLQGSSSNTPPAISQEHPLRSAEDFQLCTTRSGKEVGVDVYPGDTCSPLTNFQDQEGERHSDQSPIQAQEHISLHLTVPGKRDDADPHSPDTQTPSTAPEGREVSSVLPMDEEGPTILNEGVSTCPVLEEQLVVQHSRDSCLSPYPAQSGLHDPTPLVQPLRVDDKVVNLTSGEDFAVIPDSIVTPSKPIVVRTSTLHDNALGEVAIPPSTSKADIPDTTTQPFLSELLEDGQDANSSASIPQPTKKRSRTLVRQRTRESLRNTTRVQTEQSLKEAESRAQAVLDRKGRSASKLSSSRTPSEHVLRLRASSSVASAKRSTKKSKALKTIRRAKQTNSIAPIDEESDDGDAQDVNGDTLMHGSTDEDQDSTSEDIGGDIGIQDISEGDRSDLGCSPRGYMPLADIQTISDTDTTDIEDTPRPRPMVLSPPVIPPIIESSSPGTIHPPTSLTPNSSNQSPSPLSTASFSGPCPSEGVPEPTSGGSHELSLTALIASPQLILNGASPTTLLIQSENPQIECFLDSTVQAPREGDPEFDTSYLHPHGVALSHHPPELYSTSSTIHTTSGLPVPLSPISLPIQISPHSQAIHATQITGKDGTPMLTPTDHEEIQTVVNPPSCIEESLLSPKSSADPTSRSPGLNQQPIPNSMPLLSPAPTGPASECPEVIMDPPSLIQESINNPSLSLLPAPPKLPSQYEESTMASPRSTGEGLALSSFNESASYLPGFLLQPDPDVTPHPAPEPSKMLGIIEQPPAHTTAMHTPIPDITSVAHPQTSSFPPTPKLTANFQPSTLASDSLHSFDNKIQMYIPTTGHRKNSFVPLRSRSWQDIQHNPWDAPPIHTVHQPKFSQENPWSGPEMTENGTQPKSNASLHSQILPSTSLSNLATTSASASTSTLHIQPQDVPIYSSSSRAQASPLPGFLIPPTSQPQGLGDHPLPSTNPAFIIHSQNDPSHATPLSQPQPPSIPKATRITYPPLPQLTSKPTPLPLRRQSPAASQSTSALHQPLASMRRRSGSRSSLIPLHQESSSHNLAPIAEEDSYLTPIAAGRDVGQPARPPRRSSTRKSDPGSDYQQDAGAIDDMDLDVEGPYDGGLRFDDPGNRLSVDGTEPGNGDESDKDSQPENSHLFYRRPSSARSDFIPERRQDKGKKPDRPSRWPRKENNPFPPESPRLGDHSELARLVVQTLHRFEERSEAQHQEALEALETLVDTAVDKAVSKYMRAGQVARAAGLEYAAVGGNPKGRKKGKGRSKAVEEEDKDPRHNLYNEMMRAYIADLLHLAPKASPEARAQVDFRQFTDEELSAHEAGEFEKIDIDREGWYLDWEDRVTSKLNQHAIRFATQGFIENVTEDWDASQLPDYATDPQIVFDTLSRHVEYLLQSYRERRGLPTRDNRTTPIPANQVQDRLAQKKKRDSRYTRKRNLTRKRCKVVQLLSSLNAHEPLMTLLKNDAASGDETDFQIVYYVVNESGTEVLGRKLQSEIEGTPDVGTSNNAAAGPSTSSNAVAGSSRSTHNPGHNTGAGPSRPLNNAGDGAPPLSRVEPVYKVPTLPWRSDALNRFLWMLDEHAQRFSQTKVGAEIRKRPGGNPRIRVRTSQKARSVVAPRGLPVNCYDQDWLESLDFVTRDGLNVQGENWKFPNIAPRT